jgi:hypothetical protein
MERRRSLKSRRRQRDAAITPPATREYTVNHSVVKKQHLHKIATIDA